MINHKACLRLLCSSDNRFDILCTTKMNFLSTSPDESRSHLKGNPGYLLILHLKQKQLQLRTPPALQTDMKTILLVAHTNVSQEAHHAAPTATEPTDVSLLSSPPPPFTSSWLSAHCSLNSPLSWPPGPFAGGKSAGFGVSRGSSCLNFVKWNLSHAAFWKSLWVALL